MEQKENAMTDNQALTATLIDPFSALFGFDECIKTEESIELERRIQRNCPNVEWTHGTETSLPYCLLNGEFCDTRCMWH